MKEIEHLSDGELYIVRTINLAFSSSTKDIQHSESCSKQNILTIKFLKIKSLEI